MEDQGPDTLHDSENEALEHAIQHLWMVGEQIARKTSRKKSGNQRRIEEEALSRVLAYQANRYMKMSNDELLTLDWEQQKAYINNSFKNWKVKDVAKELKGEVRWTPDVEEPDLADSDVPTSPGKIRLNESVGLAVVLRTFEVLTARTKRPKLDKNKATVVRFFLHHEWGLPVVTAEDEALKATFTDVRRWKKDLTVALGKRTSFVSDVIRDDIKGTALTALYLFVGLAPIRRPVLDRSQMGQLLDLVFHRNRHLETPQRKILERAALCLKRDHADFLIDVAKLAKKPGTSGALRMDVTLGLLHFAEARYAARVPTQEHHPPRFRCVVRCDPHRPIEEN